MSVNTTKATTAPTNNESEFVHNALSNDEHIVETSVVDRFY